VLPYPSDASGPTLIGLNVPGGLTVVGGGLTPGGCPFGGWSRGGILRI
jgi:hypothetical protein